MASPDLHTLNDLSFDEAVARPLPTLVVFSTAWCQPCRLMHPALGQLAAEAGGRYAVAHVDVDESPVVAARFSVRALPTLVVFRSGAEVARRTGAQSLVSLRALVEGVVTMGGRAHPTA